MAKSVTTSTAKRASTKKAPAVASEISEGLPSATATAPLAQPEPKPVEGGASPSSAEASNATAQVAGTGEAAGQVVTGDLPTTDSSSNQDIKPKYVVRITSRREGFRRAGMRHSKTPTDHPFGTFTVEQLDQLETEPNLTVEYL